MRRAASPPTPKPRKGWPHSDRLARTAGRVAIPGAGDQQLFEFGEAPHDQAILAAGLLAHAQRAVEAFGQHVDAPVRDLDIEPDFGIPGEEPGQHRRQHRFGDRDWAGHPHPSARHGGGFGDHRQRRGGLGQHRLGVARQALADRRHPEAAGGALQQAHVEVPLQRVDVARQARGRHAQRAGCRRVAAVADHGRVQAQVVQRDIKPFDCIHFCNDPCQSGRIIGDWCRL